MNTKPCSKCKRTLPTSEFYKRTAKEVETRKDGLQSACKSCMKEIKRKHREDPAKRANERRLARLARVKDPVKARQNDRRYNLKALCGISVEDYDRLFAFQHGLCAVCGKPESAVLNGRLKRLAVDHCHEGGQVRGLLCSRCNTAIGLMNDDVDVLEKAQCYLLSPIACPV